MAVLLLERRWRWSCLLLACVGYSHHPLQQLGRSEGKVLLAALAVAMNILRKPRTLSRRLTQTNKWEYCTPAHASTHNDKNIAHLDGRQKGREVLRGAAQDIHIRRRRYRRRHIAVSLRVGHPGRGGRVWRAVL